MFILHSSFLVLVLMMWLGSRKKERNQRKIRSRHSVHPVVVEAVSEAHLIGSAKPAGKSRMVKPVFRLRTSKSSGCFPLILSSYLAYRSRTPSFSKIIRFLERAVLARHISSSSSSSSFPPENSSLSKYVLFSPFLSFFLSFLLSCYLSFEGSPGGSQERRSNLCHEGYVQSPAFFGQFKIFHIPRETRPKCKQCLPISVLKKSGMTERNRRHAEAVSIRPPVVRCSWAHLSLPLLLSGQERAILASTSHPFISSLRFAFQTPQRLYLGNASYPSFVSCGLCA